METISRFQMEHLPSNVLSQMMGQIKDILNQRRVQTSRGNRLRKVQEKQPVEGTPNDVYLYNSSRVLEVPNHWARRIQRNAKYLPALLAQDWSSIYSGFDPSPKYYVYAHVDPSKSVFCAPVEAGGNYGGQPFYIGKGCGQRAFDLKRNQGHGIELKRLLDLGFDASRIVKVLITGLTEAKAYEIEAKLIYFFATIYGTSTKKKGVLLNLDTPPTPLFVGKMIEDIQQIGV